ncbi:uncharacterized protein NECHADRAFT_87909 [Fusarium vanettenii 77-13-4]|uniref:Cytochrome P450 n=1 Tax=Fusarium vanettenii (strain ATCC MYA-4622 / CBS 123669 / FGSC 9596 / NRRL 45880 / 77-13-4) TaxID=660122 RepID=C7Z3D3_FUSV7|nr:uncharacterized protein NECHADRAFT_87909 [Fusarium vanettenii 77-13-4]EEU41816.1 hypothetical protein NECHADRAFT_87909 [Fusarium vanettenii 77-13-4]
MTENVFWIDKPAIAAAGAAGLFWISYLVCEVIYNLFFHPLSKFPGPKIAAIGTYYEFYHDVIRDGTYLWRIEEMHRKYGPVVRINADELHIHDPDFYSKVYAGSKRVNKYGPAVAAFTVPRATLATIDHDVHRLRRSILNPYFSKRAVTMLEPLINDKVDRLCGRLEEWIGQGTPVDLDAAMAALTADIVSIYFYGKDFDYLGGKDFKFVVRDAILGLIRFYHFSRFVPAVANFINSLPIPIVRMIQPGAAALLESQQEILVEIQQSLNDKDNVKSKSVIVGALGDPDIPAEEKTLDRLVDEGVTVIFAGTETTARSISVAIFHLLRDKSLLQKLRDELSTVEKGPDGQWAYNQLEALPYLTGCVQEGLRLAHGPVIRLPRVSPNEALQYGDWLIPAGTPVSESTLLVHLDPSIFPNPNTFDPDRWVRAAAEGVHLSKYICSFTKGTRQCLGINLAYAELYIAIAKIATSFEMELYNTSLEDVQVHHIRLTGYPKRGTGEIKATITSKA